MVTPQPNAQSPGAPPPKREHPVLVAIIGAFGLAAAAAIGGFIGHSNFSPASATTTPSISSSGHPSQSSTPHLDFVPESSGTVPWCNNFYIKASGQLPVGYKILIFDASSDAQFHVTSAYSYDGPVTPTKGNPDEWLTGNVYVAAKYKQDENGNTVIHNGKPVSNAGYTVNGLALSPDVIM
jgi:hypothetical protein